MRAATGVPSVGVLWSAVASVRSGRRTLRPGQAQPVERLRARDLVDEVQVDVDQPAGASHFVGLPDLLEHRLRHRHRPLVAGLESSTGPLGVRRVAWRGHLAAPQPAETTARNSASASPGVLEVVGQVGVEGDAVALRPARSAVRRRRAPPSRARRARSRGCRARASAGRRARPSRRPGASVCRESSARWPGCAAVSTSKRCPRRPLPPRRALARAHDVTAPSSSRRSSWESRSSRPAAMRAATVSVGLVSPRSTCESIGALTPLRAARSRSDSEDASRSAFTRAPDQPRVEWVGRGLRLSVGRC